MKKSNRLPLQVSPEFKKKLDELQKKIMMKRGEKPSLRELTEEIISNPLFNEIEQKIVNGEIGDINMNINLKFDRRVIR